MRIGWLALVLALPLSADVVILKDGTRESGEVIDKGDSYEVRTKHGTLTIAKSEVDRIATDPKDALKEADAQREEARKLYESGAAKTDATEHNSDLDAAVRLLEKAKKTYTETRLDFPEPAYEWLDQEILAIGQAIKLARDKHVLANDPQTDAPRKEYEKRRAAVAVGDANGHYALGEWCDSKGLTSEAHAEYEEALRLEPNHAKAREKLGFVFYEGKWMTPKERDQAMAQKTPPTPQNPPPQNPPPQTPPSNPPAQEGAPVTDADIEAFLPSIPAIDSIPKDRLASAKELCGTLLSLWRDRGSPSNDIAKKRIAVAQADRKANALPGALREKPPLLYIYGVTHFLLARGVFADFLTQRDAAGNVKEKEKLAAAFKPVYDHELGAAQDALEKCRKAFPQHYSTCLFEDLSRAWNIGGIKAVAGANDAKRDAEGLEKKTAFDAEVEAYYTGNGLPPTK